MPEPVGARETIGALMPRAVVRHTSTLTAFRTHAPLPASLGPAGGSAYARWLEDLVRRFGAGAVGRWREPPEGLDFASWKTRRRVVRPLLGEAS